MTIAAAVVAFMTAGVSGFAPTPSVPPLSGNSDSLYHLGWSEMTTGSEMWSEGGNYLVSGEVVFADQTVLSGGAYQLLPGSGSQVPGPPIELLTGNLYLRTPAPSRAGIISTFAVHGATPESEIVFTCSNRRGLTELNQCTGVAVDLSEPQIMEVVRADVNGIARLSKIMPATESPRPIIFQALEASSCRVSNPVVCTFE
ncbi:MAG: hypothetical protein D8M59_06565 [Planctomycetes bacterium]|nr:hypothetical protein [Planctomycetota bacterium]